MSGGKSTDTRFEVRVESKWLEAEDIYAFALAGVDGGVLPPFTPGAHVEIVVSEHLVRQYSLFNSPKNRSHYQIGVLREPSSRGGSKALIERTHVGDILSIGVPTNHFPLEPAAKHSILIAGGIGITPLLSMATHLSDTGASFQLHYGTRSLERTAFHRHIKESAFADHTTFHFDNGPAAQRLNLTGALGRWTAGIHLYVCGPSGLIEAVLACAKMNGWPDTAVHREYFAAPEALADASQAAGSFEVQLASSGRTYPIGPDQSIAEVLIESGIDVPVSCQTGVCGTCLTSVLAGEPDHRDFFLTPEERARNDRMLLCCSRAKSAVLTLKL